MRRHCEDEATEAHHCEHSAGSKKKYILYCRSQQIPNPDHFPYWTVEEQIVTGGLEDINIMNRNLNPSERESLNS